VITVKKHTDDFNEFIKQGFVVVEFFAPWCAKCKGYNPNIESVIKELNIQLIKVNSDDNKLLMSEHSIKSVPTTLIFKNGNIIDTKIGHIEKDELKRWIESYL
jgi:thioredoxin 1